MSATRERDFNNRETRLARAEDVSGRSSERSISELFQEIVRSITEIIKSEFRLASTELKRDLSDRSKAATYLGIAGVLMLFTVALLLLGVVYALSTVWPAWLAAVVPGIVLGIAGGIFFIVGRQRMKQRLKMEMTAQTVEDNVRWLKNQMK